MSLSKSLQKTFRSIRGTYRRKSYKKIEPIQQYFNQIQEFKKWNKKIEQFKLEHDRFDEYVEDISKSF